MNLPERSAATYADFFTPQLTPDMHLLDVGCGDGSITLGLAPLVRQVTAVDVKDDFTEARGTVDFRVGDVYQLEGRYDAVFAHSVLEALDEPDRALKEMSRVLRPGGVIGVASVEYDGIVLAGPRAESLRRFYAIRERLWQVGGSDPYLGRTLRGRLIGAGFVDVVATTKAIPYGTDEAVRSFGRDRAEDCRDEWYVQGALDNQLADRDELAAMEQAWWEWSTSPDAYFAFTWCRAVGRRP